MELKETGGGWSPGKVAELLGISPVTLRSWSARYGIGPAAHERGHRRYSDLDVRRLQHMQRLIERGMRAREAAAAAFSASSPPEVPANRRIAELADAAEQVRFEAVSILLDETLEELGAAATWTEVLLPVMRRLGERWLGGEVCFAAEWTIATEISRALERFSRGNRPAVPGGRPVVLACCPDERHSLPIEALSAALVELGVPVVYLGPAVPAETVTELTARLDPALLVLWSISPSTADDLLVRRLAGRGVEVAVAGPGWAALTDRGFTWVDDLGSALDLATDHARV